MRYRSFILEKDCINYHMILKEVPVKAMAANMISNDFNIILDSFRRRDTQLVLITHFDSYIDSKVQEVWVDQRDIGWNQILKGCLSKKWGKDQ